MSAMGSAIHAETIYNFCLYVRSMRLERGYSEVYDYIKIEHAAPEGWEYIGNGADRYVYLGPDGVVYKIEPWGNYQNEQEFTVWNKYIGETLPLGVQFPHMEEYRFDNGTVNAVQGVCSDEGVNLSDWSYEIDKALRGTRYSSLIDIKAANIAVMDGVPYILDLGVSD